MHRVTKLYFGALAFVAIVFYSMMARVHGTESALVLTVGIVGGLAVATWLGTTALLRARRALK